MELKSTTNYKLISLTIFSWLTENHSSNLATLLHFDYYIVSRVKLLRTTLSSLLCVNSKSIEPGTKTFAHEVLLIKRLMRQYPELYDDELQEWLQYLNGHAPSLTSIRRLWREMGWTRRKLNLVAQQRDDRRRAEFRRFIAQFDPQQLLFIDESAKDERTFQRRYIHALKGLRISRKGNFTRGTKYSVLSALSIQGIEATHTVLGAFDRTQFEFAMNMYIVPLVGSVALRETCSVVVMDNCIIHSSNQVIEAIRQKGGIVVYLPPYSPDMNPIEEAFGCCKTWLQRHKDICIAYPKQCFDIALDKITHQQATGFFRDSGYF